MDLIVPLKTDKNIIELCFPEYFKNKFKALYDQCYVCTFATVLNNRTVENCISSCNERHDDWRSQQEVTEEKAEEVS